MVRLCGNFYVLLTEDPNFIETFFHEVDNLMVDLGLIIICHLLHSVFFE